MLQRLKKVFGFGDVVDEARRGTISRRGFLQAVAALGVLPEEAAKELGKCIYAVPSPKIILNPWQEALLDGRAWQNAGVFAFVANIMHSEEGKWSVEFQDRPMEKAELVKKLEELREDLVLPNAPQVAAPSATLVAPGGSIIQVGSSWK